MSKKSVREHFEMLSSEALRTTSGETDLRVTQDAATKLKKVGQAFSEGKMPTTEQATIAMNKARLDDIDNMDLSETGQQVLKQMDEAFASTTKMVSEKNKGDHLQHMVQHSKATAGGLKDGDLFSSAKKRSSSHAKDTMDLLKEGGSNISLVARLIITSPQFRSLLGDFYNIFENTIDQFTEAPSVVDSSSPRVSTKQLRDNVVVGPVSKTKDADEAKGMHKNTEITESLDPSAPRAASGPGSENFALDAEDIYEKSKEKMKNDVGKPAVKLLSETIKSNFNNSKDGDFSNVHNEALETGKDLKQNVKNRLQNIKLTAQAKENLISRFRNLCSEVQGNEDYKKAMVKLIENISQLSSYTQTYTKDLSGIASNQTNTKDGLVNISSHSRQIVENFAGGNSMEPMLDSLKGLAKKAEKDPQLENYFKTLKNFIVDSCLSQDFIEDEGYHQKAESLIDESKKYLTEEYRGDTKSILKEVKLFNSSLQEDPTTNEFVKSFETLGRTLFLDENGKPTIKRELVEDVRKIIPLIGQKLKLLRLPRIEHEDEKVHIILDNLVLQCAGILPNSVYIRTDTEFDVADDRMLNAVTLKIRNINGSAHKVAFYVRIKKGLVKTEEAGYIDVDIPKQGVTLDLTIAPQNVRLRKPKTAQSDSRSSLGPSSNNAKDEYKRDVLSEDDNDYIKVLRSNCRVHDMKIKLYDTKHPQFIYKLFSGIINSIAKKKVEEGINDGVRQIFSQVNNTAKGNGLPSKDKDTNTKTVKNTSTGSITENKSWKSDAFDI